MERVNAYLENEPSSYNPSSQDFFIFEYEYNDYAVGTEDFCVYQVIDWNPLEDEDSNVDILYTDGNGLYFNYAEDGDFDKWLMNEFNFDLDALYGFYEEDVLELLAESDDLSDFASKWVKTQVEKYGEPLEEEDYSDECAEYIEETGKELKDESYDSIVGSFLIELEKSLNLEGYVCCAIDNDDITHIEDDISSEGNLVELGYNDITFDDLAIYNGATKKIHVSGNGSNVDWVENEYYKPNN